MTPEQHTLLRRLLSNEADMSFKHRARAVFDFLDLAAGDRVLDMGCGRGFYLNLMRHLTPEVDVVGAELDQRLLPVARANVPACRVLAANVYDLPFPPAAFNKVIFSEVIEHVEDDAAALAELHRVTAPDGVVAVTAPHADYPLLWDPINKILESTVGRPIRTGPLAGIWANHVRLYTPEDLVRRATDAGFEVLDVRFLVHYSFPFSHNLVYGLGKTLMERGSLPPELASAADRFGADGASGSPLNPVRLGVAAFNAVDWLNQIDPPMADDSSVNIAVQLRKPATRQSASQQAATQQAATRQSASRQPATRQPATRQPASRQPAYRQSANG